MGTCYTERAKRKCEYVDSQVNHKEAVRQGEVTMGDKGKKDKSNREERKKAKLNPKEKKKLKNEKKKKVTPFGAS